MFHNRRYLSCGIVDTIGEDIQKALWQMVDNLKESGEVELDNLQAFSIYSIEDEDEPFLLVIHSQKNGEYEKMHKLHSLNHINVKIFVEDDECKSTMLLQSEY